jgi:multiple sugar transport system ATP-binding protein
MKPTRVFIENIAKTFYNIRGNVEALSDINIQIEPGEFFVLLGPSGSGKTTLLKLVAGLERPDRGEIRFSDELVSSAEKEVFVSPKDRGISFVFQNYALYPHMTVAKNIEFPLLHLKKNLTREQRYERILDVAGSLKIGELLRRKPKELSEGQRQRVAIARAIIREPRVFLMDEPLANLDAKLRVQIRTQLKELQRQTGITTLYVTHDQNEAMALGDRVAVLHDGVIQQAAAPTEIYNTPSNVFVAQFVGGNPINMLEGELIFDSGQSFFQSGKIKIRLEEQVASRIKEKTFRKCFVGIRPEHVEVMPEGKGVVDVSLVLAENVGSKYLLYAFSDYEKGMHIETKTLPDADLLGKRYSLALNPINFLVFDSIGRRIDLSV